MLRCKAERVQASGVHRVVGSSGAIAVMTVAAVMLFIAVLHNMRPIWSYQYSARW